MTCSASAVSGGCTPRARLADASPRPRASERVVNRVRVARFDDENERCALRQRASLSRASEPGSVCIPVDEFLAELEARMASATRADGVHPPLTAEALQVIAAADQGGTPLFTSANLARIAKENGVDVSSDMTPNDIIAELRRRQRP